VLRVLLLSGGDAKIAYRLLTRGQTNGESSLDSMQDEPETLSDGKFNSKLYFHKREKKNITDLRHKQAEEQEKKHPKMHTSQLNEIVRRNRQKNSYSFSYRLLTRGQTNGVGESSLDSMQDEPETLSDGKLLIEYKEHQNMHCNNTPACKKTDYR
jgi:hypothetical protein